MGALRNAQLIADHARRIAPRHDDDRSLFREPLCRLEPEPCKVPKTHTQSECGARLSAGSDLFFEHQRSMHGEF